MCLTEKKVLNRKQKVIIFLLVYLYRQTIKTVKCSVLNTKYITNQMEKIICLKLAFKPC